jgi:hypothetical protein
VLFSLNDAVKRDGMAAICGVRQASRLSPSSKISPAILCSSSTLHNNTSEADNLKLETGATPVLLVGYNFRFKIYFSVCPIWNKV